MLREVIKVGTTASKGLFFLGRIETEMGDLVGGGLTLVCFVGEILM